MAPCPACTGNLAEMLLGTVHVDYCGTCHGIFLDRGELAVRHRGGPREARDRNTHRLVIAIRPPATS